ncbi:MAG: GNAT family N-acetyltransferase [Acidocella sp.]|nr:GNAT family N-acetyltransferase [Acidocella sp.]
MSLTAPEPLAAHHDVTSFQSGEGTLDTWLKHHALKNQFSGASRTFVVCKGARIMAYYALACGAVATNTASGRLQRDMPDPIPVIALRRLAVDKTLHGQGLRHALVQNAAQRVLHAADTIGIRSMLVHALSEGAKAFYMRLGFEPSPIDPMILMITLADLAAAHSK